MSLDTMSGRRSVSPTSSGRSSPVPRSRRAVEDGLYKADKSLRRYAAIVERALGTWDTAPQEWADYIAFLGRLLKAIQSHPRDVPLLPHSRAVASKLAQCLNPALPSGVHQKALEVYSYIFAIFGAKYLSTHLHEYLPGLSSVLSFASLSVRPGLYILFEQHIVQLPCTDLRSALKSLILALLPAIEEETSEDFDRAYAILETLERKFAPSTAESSAVQLQDGYFWQCMFLSVVTSPSRRQGAHNYLARRLPRFAASPNAASSGGLEQLSPEAEAVLSPEPGLLVRCFVAGLSDAQMLIQRGFLDILVTHLPLHSPALQEKVEESDLDLLVSAAVSVLLRRDMSLNRRLWTWFLGPEPKDEGSPTAQRSQAAGQSASVQLRYFETYGKGSLERCALAMFNTKETSPTQKARPYRVCLSLMDRWEIGGSLVPRIFQPALESLHSYTLSAAAPDVSEVLRSATLFFDGVEANLIWLELVSILQKAFGTNDAAIGDLRLFQWVLDNFNVTDEEMVTVHIPLAALYFLCLLNSRPLSARVDGSSMTALQTLAKLLALIPARAFVPHKDGSPVSGTPNVSHHDILGKIDNFYHAPAEMSSKANLPFGNATLAHLLQRHTFDLTSRTLQTDESRLFALAVQMLQNMLLKVPGLSRTNSDDLQEQFALKLACVGGQPGTVPFQTISAIVSLLVTLQSKDLIDQRSLLEFEHALTNHLWRYLAPTLPKFHVEAVRSLWQLDDLVNSDDGLNVSLLAFLRSANGSSLYSGHDRPQAIKSFMILWNHTLPSQPAATKVGAFGIARRGSAVPNVADSAQVARRLGILSEPLLLVLDALYDPSDFAYEPVKDWISDLPSLDQVLSIMLQRMRETLVGVETAVEAADETQQRREVQYLRDLVYYIELLDSILRIGNDWTWDCLCTLDTKVLGFNGGTGTVELAKACVRILSTQQRASHDTQKAAVTLLETLVASPAAAELTTLDLDSSLLDRLIAALRDDEDALQGSLLRLIPVTMKLRLSEAFHGNPPMHRPRTSLSVKTPSTISTNPSGSTLALATAPTPPKHLLRCIQMGFTSQSARRHMSQWLGFLASILPTFADAIFASLIPLVDCFCAELNKTFSELRAVTTTHSSWTAIAPPDDVILVLLEALELILARAHDSLLYAGMPETPSKPAAQSNSFLGSVASGVFKVDGPPSKTSQSNSRLTVILAFQDCIRTCLNIWTWSSYSGEANDIDVASAATTAYSALRLRHKTRYLLEQIFSVEPLESLEVAMAQWRFATKQDQAAAALSLLQVMQGSRPKTVIPVILDALCSRTNHAALPPVRQSSQTVDITAIDVALFLLAYLEATEDDAMDEVWTDCIAFTRDVLANPLPYRLVLPSLLSLVHLLAEKVGNTNFGEQRKMRRELGDLFQRLMAATFTTLPSSSTTNAGETPLYKHDVNGGSAIVHREAKSLVAVLTRSVMDFEAMLETPERITAAINTITASLFGPTFRSKSFPANISLEHLTLLLAMAKKAPTAKAWKKEIVDVFNDARFLASPVSLVQAGWLPLLHQWSIRDRDRMADLLSRLAPPSSAGIMFGVGASAARLDADRKTQLNLRRICLLLLASPQDAWIAHLRDFDEKLVELSGATHSSSPSSTIKAELFMLCMALVLSLTPVHLSPLWPSINDGLQAALTSLFPKHATEAEFTNSGLLQACKLLDQLVALSPDEFQLHEWLYIADTVDAVYRPNDWTATALSDQIADALGTGTLDDSQTGTPSTHTSSAVSGVRGLLLQNDIAVDNGDIRALPRGDFATAVLRPFLNQLSIHAYEGVYSMDTGDVEACRHRLLEDVLDLSTIVE